MLNTCVTEVEAKLSEIHNQIQMLGHSVYLMNEEKLTQVMSDDALRKQDVF